MLQCKRNLVKKENSMKKIAITSIAFALTAAAIHAHTVDNPAVQKRMDVMKEIKGAN